MTKPQLTVRIPPALLERLDNYTQQTGSSKTDVVVDALGHYLGCATDLPLKQRVANLELRTTALEASIQTH
jgi:predicted DNA-binding protein